VEIDVKLPTAEEWETVRQPRAVEATEHASPVTTDVDPHSYLAPAVWPGAEGGDWRKEGFKSRSQVAAASSLVLDCGA
jgi:hypothetical protein